MHSLLAQQSEAVVNAVRKIAPDVVLATPVEDLADGLYEKLGVEAIVVHRDRRTSSGAKDVTLSLTAGLAVRRS